MNKKTLCKCKQVIESKPKPKPMKILCNTDQLSIVKINGEHMIVRKNDSMVIGKIDIVKVFNDRLEIDVKTEYGKIHRKFYFKDMFAISDALYTINHPTL